MDLVGSIANLSVSMSQERLSRDVGVSVLRKALDTREAAAMRLIDSMAAPRVLPEHLGRHVNRVV
jgi:Putative motility protein